MSENQNKAVLTKELLNRKTLEQGLTEEQAAQSKQQYGTNALAKKEAESLWSMFIGAFNDIWIKVLCLALVLKIVLAILGVIVPALGGENDVIEIISIVIAIALATGFSTLSEYRNTSRSEALQEEYNKTYAKVFRNGKLVKILTSDIVKGDTILIQAGDKVPVDGLLFKGNVKVSQAALNGESRDESKTAADSMEEAESTDYSSAHKVFMGSVVTSGEAYMVATVIGDASELGKINKALTDDNEEEERKDTSSLKLEVVAGGIGKLGVSAAVIAGVLQVFLSIIRADEAITPVFVLLLIAEAVMLMASIVIMAVPEGLPMMNSLVQSMNTESMYKKNILVSHKAAFSDSAYMNLLFSDKTGTITEGNLSLVEFVLGDGRIVDHISHNDFLEAITLNNLAKISEGKAIGSNNMDRALLTYSITKGGPEKVDASKVKEISGFDSEKKCATVELNDGTVYWKGATENIINEVTHYMTEDGRVIDFTPSEKAKVEEQMVAQAKRTMKLLSVAKISDGKTVLMAVLCLRDNVRTDAVETVQILNDAGIQVVMVTGDAEETAVAIAKEAGILADEKKDVVLTHEEMEKLSDEELKKVLPNLRVVSRAKPLDKKRLVSLSQQIDNVCGMTGDGVNDVLALKEADCSVVMAEGSDAAKNIANVVLMDSNFAAMPEIVNQGRRVVNNIRTAASMFLIKTIFSVLLCLITIFWGDSYPFEPIQMSLISACAVGIPTFLLAQENNFNKIESGFLRYVFMNAFPAAVTITGCVFTIMLVCQNVYHSNVMLSTACFLVTGWNYMAALKTVYAPLSRYRKIIIYGMQFIFFFAAVCVQNLLALGSLEFGMIILVFILMTFSPVVIEVITEWCRSLYNKAHEKEKKGIISLFLEKVQK